MILFLAFSLGGVRERGGGVVEFGWFVGGSFLLWSGAGFF